LDYAIIGLIYATVLISLSLLSVRGNWIYSLAFFLVQWFFMAACELLSGGISFGKRIVGLRVLMRDGTRIRPGAAMLRNLLRLADQYAVVGLVAMLIVPGFRRLGDLVAGTIVVHSSQRLARPIPTDAFAGTLPIAPWRPIDEEASDAAVEYARRRRQLGPERAEELAKIGLAVYLGEERPLSERSSASELLSGIGVWCAGVRASPAGGEAAR
jgi:uncharacterized RDD family membrane protein YckC